MDLLQGKRIGALHQEFLEAAKQFPGLCYIAATPAEQIVRVYGENTLSVDYAKWPQTVLTWPSGMEEEQLGLLRGGPLSPLSGVYVGEQPLMAGEMRVWVWIDGRLWDGDLFGGNVYSAFMVRFLQSARQDMRKRSNRKAHEKLCQELQARYQVLKTAMEQFWRLATAAFQHLAIPSPPTAMADGLAAGLCENVDRPDWMLERLAEPLGFDVSGWKTVSRWLEVVAGMAWIPVKNHNGLLVRRVPGDVFTASARAIETLYAAADRAPANLRCQHPPSRRQEKGTAGALRRRPRRGGALAMIISTRLRYGRPLSGKLPMRRPAGRRPMPRIRSQPRASCPSAHLTKPSRRGRFGNCFGFPTSKRLRTK